MAERFLYQAFEAEGLPSVLWIVLLAGGLARQSPASAAPKVSSAPSP